MKIEEINKMIEEKKKSETLMYFSEIDNAVDSLETAVFLIDRDDSGKWKWVSLCIYHSLYNFCIASLTNGFSGNVLQDKRGKIFYSRDEVNWKKAVWKKIDGTTFGRIQWNDVTDKSELPKIDNNIPNTDEVFYEYEKNDLISFQCALSRVMDQEYWMGRYYDQKGLKLSDEEIKDIDKIHKLRNDFIHFKPKLVIYDIETIKKKLEIYLKAITFLVFDSNSILEIGEKPFRDRVEELLHKLSIELDIQN